MELRCGYRTSIGYGFESLLQHLETEHGKDISNEKEDDYISWHVLNIPLVLSGKGHKEKHA